MNVLVMGARVIGPGVAIDIVRAFVTARFTDEVRHRRRPEKVAAIERRCRNQSDPANKGGGKA